MDISLVLSILFVYLSKYLYNNFYFFVFSYIGLLYACKKSYDTIYDSVKYNVTTNIEIYAYII